MKRDVIIIGAGVSGLTAAHDLRARGYDVQVLERQVNIGGNAISERFGGYLMEHGPSTLNTAVEGALARIGALGLAASALDLGAGVQKRYLLDHDHLRGISLHPLGFFTSSYLSPLARLRMAAEVLRPRRRATSEEKLFDFAHRRFGREFAHKVIDPLAAGLFMGDASSLSISGAFPKLMEMEQKHGSIIRGILAARRGKEPGRQLYSWAGGMAAVPRALAVGLDGCVQNGVAVTKIIPTPTGFEVVTARSGRLSARTVVLAVQPHVAACLLEQAEPASADAARSIAAPSIGVVFLGYRRAQVTHPLDGLGYLSTKNPNRIISGAQFCSTMFAGRAPEGHVSIACYCGGARNPQLANLPDAALADQVTRELSDLLGIKGAPAVIRIRRWARGLPQYDLGHKTRLEILSTTHQRLPGMFVTGNYMQGVSIANCMAAAGATAERVHAALQTRQTPGRVMPTHIGGEASKPHPLEPRC
jgi:protoporphyrinogen/coproporphyrinogen III oxidase